MKFPSSPMSAFSVDEGPEPPPMHGFVMDNYMETQFQQNLEQRGNVSPTTHLLQVVRMMLMIQITVNLIVTS